MKLLRTLRFLLRPLADLRDWLYCTHPESALSAPRIEPDGTLRRECRACFRLVRSKARIELREYNQHVNAPLPAETALAREAREAQEKRRAIDEARLEEELRDMFGRR